MSADDPFAAIERAQAGPERVLVPTGRTTRDGTARYHRPTDEAQLAPACTAGACWPEDGQLMARPHAERAGLEPCRHAACFGGERP